MEIMEFVVSVPIPIPITMLRFQCRGLQMALFISLIKVEHPLKTSNKKAPMALAKISLYCTLKKEHLLRKTDFKVKLTDLKR